MMTAVMWEIMRLMEQMRERKEDDTVLGAERKEE